MFLGDIMGCGILFPNDYDSEADSDQSPDDPDVSNRELDEYPSDSDSEDENMWWRQGNDEQGTKVQVRGLSYQVIMLVHVMGQQNVQLSHLLFM